MTLNRIFAILTLGPLVLWGVAIAIVVALGTLGGCDIDEGSVHPCVVLGRDVGDAAYTLGMYAAWGPLFFGPVVIGAGLLWAIVAGVRWLRK